MNYLSEQFEALLTGAALMLILMGLGVAIIMPGVDRWSKNFFMIFFFILALYGGFGLLDLLIQKDPNLLPYLEIDYYFETLLAFILIFLLPIYLFHCCGEDLRRSRVFHVQIILFIAMFIMLNLSLFTTWFYTLSRENVFQRGPLYTLLMAVLFTSMLLTLICLFRWRDRLSGRYFIAFLIGSLPMTIAVFVHIFVTAFIFFAFGISICALSMFGLILSDQIEQNLQQQREIAKQQASITVLQMRPHFIYNTMMSIYYLCKQDADLAQLVTLDFTTYLRKNFTAIASEDTIPFSEELEHTRAYLSVEQAQFEDMLFVKYDTSHTEFRLPPLTLQPIVENCVKHGLDPDSDPLQILITTRRTDSGSEIIVEDNGSGFGPADNNEPHIALSNVTQRLAMMCDGELSIAPREGGGTVVKVTVRQD